MSVNIQYLALAFVAAAVLYKVYQSLKGKSLVKLSPGNFQKYKLIEKTDVISPDVGMHTMRFRFELPAGYALDLPCGQHISIKGFNESKAMVVRQYTPTTNQNTIGHFDVIIKIYPNGQMGNYLKNLPLGSMVEVKGPSGHLKYKGKGIFEIRRKNEETNTVQEVQYNVKNVGMIAGGSGITPMLQVVQTVYDNVADDTKIQLLYGNRSVGDIMCREELEDMVEKSRNFNCFFTVDSCTDKAWKGGVGFLTKDILGEKLPKPANDTLILLCGPPPMTNFMVGHLKALGYTDDMIFVY